MLGTVSTLPVPTSVSLSRSAELALRRPPLEPRAQPPRRDVNVPVPAEFKFVSREPSAFAAADAAGVVVVSVNVINEDLDLRPAATRPSTSSVHHPPYLLLAGDSYELPDQPARGTLVDKYV